MSDASWLWMVGAIAYLVFRAVLKQRADAEARQREAELAAAEAARQEASDDDRGRAFAVGEGVLRRAEDLKARLESGPASLGVLRELVVGRVVPELATAVADARTAHTRRALAGAEAVIRLALVRVAFLDQVRRWRTDPILATHLADADALAAVLLEPLSNLAASQGLDFASHRPISVPADPEGEAIMMGLLPPGYPVIFVPPDFADNLFRWAAIPHEIGHLVWRRLPGFADEVRDRAGLDEGQGLLTVEDLEADGLALPFAAWLEELVCDAFAVWLLGPAALRAYIECFQSPNDVERVLWAGAHPDDPTAYGEHPPSHLRVLLAARQLEWMGYGTDAKALRSDWQSRHGDPQYLFFQASPSPIAIPASVVETYGADLMAGIREGSYASLGGREIRSVHGLELSAGAWSKVRSAVSELLDGHPSRQDPRIVVAAAIEARARAPASARRIADAVMRSILGRDSDERRPADRSYELSPTRGSSPGLDDYQAAILLRAVLARRR